jgi:hypothetical protein
MITISKAALAAVSFAALMALGGCDTTSAVAGYQPSTSNVLAFQSALKPAGKNLKVGDFTAGPGVSAPTCRMAGSLDVSPGKPLEQYVKDALQSELFTAQVYDVSALVAITGRLDEVKVNTFGTGSWTLGLQVSSSVDPTGYHVQTVRTFKTSYSAIAACQNATNAFAATVQDLIGQVVGNPGFAKLSGKS